MIADAMRWRRCGLLCAKEFRDFSVVRSAVAVAAENVLLLTKRRMEEGKEGEEGSVQFLFFL